jgi:hypothetical protein
MLTPVRKMGTFSLRREEGQWGLPLNGSLNWPSYLCWSSGLLGSASLAIWLGRLVGQQVFWAHLASWLIGIMLGNLGLMGHAGWQNGGLARPVGWVGNLSRV